MPGKNAGEKKKLNKEDKEKLYDMFVRKNSPKTMKTNSGKGVGGSTLNRAKSPGRAVERVNDEEK